MDRNKMRRQAQILRSKKRVRAARRQETQVKSGVIKIDSPIPRKSSSVKPKPIATASQINKSKMEQKKAAKSPETRRELLKKYKQKRRCGSCKRKTKK